MGFFKNNNLNTSNRHQTSSLNNTSYEKRMNKTDYNFLRNVAIYGK